MQETDERRGIVQQAIDTLPADSPDRLWLTFVTDNVATTPQSVLFMAIQTARDILGLDGPLELGPSEPVATQAVDGPAVVEAVHPTVAEDLPVVIQAEVIRSSEDPVDEVVAPDLSDEDQSALHATVAEDAEYAEYADDAEGILPVTGDDLDVAADQDVSDDRAQQEDLHLGPAPTEDHDSAADDSGDWTPTPTPFGFVPAEVDDAVFATEGNSRIALDLDFVSDEAEEAYAEEVGRDAQQAEALAGLEASWAGIETPLPCLPPMPPLVDSATSEVYGSEPAPL